MSDAKIEISARLLIVDDNQAIHADFQKILGRRPGASAQMEAAEESLFGEPPAAEVTRSCTFHLDSAHQGQEGLELVKQALVRGEPYSLAFMDVRMPPGWDGIETTAKIWEVDPDIQIVICTAYSDYSWEAMLRKLGQSDRLVILKKPFDNIEVAQLAHSLTRKWQLLQESKKKMAGLEEMVAARTAQLAQAQEKLQGIFEHSPEGIFQTTREGHYLSANPALAAMYGYKSPEELMERLKDVQTELYVDPSRRAEWQRRMEQENMVREFESEIHCHDGSKKWISETACKVMKPDGSFSYYQGFVVDITAQKSAQRENNLMEVHLRQAQKLESVGQLAAGIAHEINTPVQYIGDNIRFVEDSFTGLGKMFADCQALAAAVKSKSVTPQLLTALEQSSEAADLPYLTKEIPLAVTQSLDGVRQVAAIVRAMKEFSHPGTVEKVLVNLNHAIETTLTVARNEWKYVAEIETDFAADLPQTPCIPGEFNQVILNLVVNAAHAIGDVVGDKPGAKGRIKITTRREGAWARIDISDTGTGIREENRHRIFEPFFTTKEVGRGTGQGLAIARSTIVTKHGGELTFETTMGQGTTFTIRLPFSETSSETAKLAAA